MLIPQEIIRKKRDRENLSAPDLHQFMSAYLNSEVTDYQVSALLMAIFLNGASVDEIVSLTKIMRDSGKVLPWGNEQHRVVDKHSTGGVGDKSSLILLPLAVLEGALVPMMSGRGLGHTGGTVDKLEAIPGMTVRQSAEKAQRLVLELGGAFLGQSKELAPLDQKLYALRDVTATVESIPLITASILSKKLAEGLSALVLDVKFGNGAFMSTLAQARELAHSMVNVARACGLRAQALLTTMEQPLGTHAGHTLEVLECLDVLRDGGPTDTKQLSVSLAAKMISMLNPERKWDEIVSTMNSHLSSGRALECFKKIIAAQGGDIRYLDEPNRFEKAPVQLPVIYKGQETAFIEKINVRALGIALIELGGGRRTSDDAIDPRVGFSDLVAVGTKIEVGSLIGTVHAASLAAAEQAVRTLTGSYAFSRTPVQALQLVQEEI